MSIINCYDEILKIMTYSAVAAGKHIRSIYREKYFNIKDKKDGSPVTRADIESAQIIEQLLRGSYPDFDILCEESNDILTSDGTPRRLFGTGCFIIDPLDGTKCFIDGSDDFAVSIAFSQSHILIAGVVYSPMDGVLYYAAKNRGAYKLEGIYDENSFELFTGKNCGEKITVSERYENLIYVTGLYSNDKREKHVIKSNSDRIAKVIKKGSCIKGCLIAEGKADVHYRFADYTKEWDTAGMQIICSEAGAVVTDVYGTPLEANRIDMINKNGIRILNRIESKLNFEL